MARESFSGEVSLAFWESVNKAAPLSYTSSCYFDPSDYRSRSGSVRSRSTSTSSRSSASTLLGSSVYERRTNETLGLGFHEEGRSLKNPKGDYLNILTKLNENNREIEKQRLRVALEVQKYRNDEKFRRESFDKLHEKVQDLDDRVGRLEQRSLGNPKLDKSSTRHALGQKNLIARNSGTNPDIIEKAWLSAQEDNDKEVSELLEGVVDCSLRTLIDGLPSDSLKDASVFSLFCIHAESECLFLKSLCGVKGAINNCKVPLIMARESFKLSRTARKDMLDRFMFNNKHRGNDDTIRSSKSEEVGFELEELLSDNITCASRLMKALEMSEASSASSISIGDELKNGGRFSVFHPTYMTPSLMMSWLKTSEAEKADLIVNYLEDHGITEKGDSLWKACLKMLEGQIHYHDLAQLNLNSTSYLNQAEVSKSLRSSLFYCLLDGWGEASFKQFYSGTLTSASESVYSEMTQKSENHQMSYEAIVSTTENSIPSDFADDIEIPTDYKSITKTYSEEEAKSGESNGKSESSIPQGTETTERVFLNMKELAPSEHDESDDETIYHESLDGSEPSIESPEYIKPKGEFDIPAESIDNEEIVTLDCAGRKEIIADKDNSKSMSPMSESEQSLARSLKAREVLLSYDIPRPGPTFDAELNKLLMYRVASRISKGLSKENLSTKEVGENRDSLSHLVLDRPVLNMKRRKSSRTRPKRTSTTSSSSSSRSVRVEAYMVQDGNKEPVIAWKELPF